jgi:hypothetical protein
LFVVKWIKIKSETSLAFFEGTISLVLCQYCLELFSLSCVESSSYSIVACFNQCRMEYVPRCEWSADGKKYNTIYWYFHSLHSFDCLFTFDIHLICTHASFLILFFIFRVCVQLLDRKQQHLLYIAIDQTEFREDKLSVTRVNPMNGIQILKEETTQFWINVPSFVLLIEFFFVFGMITKFFDVLFHSPQIHDLTYHYTDGSGRIIFASEVQILISFLFHTLQYNKLKYILELIFNN